MSSERSFDEFYLAMNGRVVRSVFLMVGDLEEAKDISQEVFARAFERWGVVGDLDRPEFWVYKVATNLSLSSLRRRRRASGRGDGLEPVMELALPEPELRAAVLALPPAQRGVVVLRFFLDASVEETARVMHKRPGTVRALTFQAMTRLREAIQDPREVES